MKILKIAAAATLLSFAVVACDDGSNENIALETETEVLNTTPYPETMRTNFMTNCINNGGAEALCTCVLTEMERTVPVEDMMAAGQEAQSGGGVSTQYTDRIVEANVRCALASTDNPPAPVDTKPPVNPEEAPVP